jgi:hypothetical protein
MNFRISFSKNGEISPGINNTDVHAHGLASSSSIASLPLSLPADKDPQGTNTQQHTDRRWTIISTVGRFFDFLKELPVLGTFLRK